MDGSDPTSLCVRSLIGRQLNGLSLDEESDPHVPLALVDWYMEQARFDEGPYLSTVLGLDWMVRTALGITPIKDFMDFGAIEKQIRSFETRSILGIDLSEARERLKVHKDFNDRPFSYTDSEGGELERITEAFKRIWAPGITKLLLEFRPYRMLVDERKAKENGLQFANWYILYRSKIDSGSHGKSGDIYNAFINHLQNHPEHPISANQLNSVWRKPKDLKRVCRLRLMWFFKISILGIYRFQIVARFRN